MKLSVEENSLKWKSVDLISSPDFVSSALCNLESVTPSIWAWLSSFEKLENVLLRIFSIKNDISS